MLAAINAQRRDKDTSYLMVAYIYSEAAFSYIFVIKSCILGLYTNKIQNTSLY